MIKCLPKYLDCDLFARVIPAKGNRIIAKPYFFSISESGLKSFVPSAAVKPSIRTIPAIRTLPATANRTTTASANTKPSVLQTKVNDFFKIPQTINSRPPPQSNLTPSLERAPQNTNRLSGNLYPLYEQLPSLQISNSNGQTYAPLVKPQQSPKSLSSRSLLYDFDDSFMSTQLSIPKGKHNDSLKLTHPDESVPKPDPPTPISLKLVKAKNTGNEFVTARSIFCGTPKIVSLSIDDFDYESLHSPISITQNEHWASKNIIACIETTQNVLPKQSRRLEQSIAKILNCNVNASVSNRQYRQEFEQDSELEQPLDGAVIDLTAKQVTDSHEQPKEKQPRIQKENFCDTFFSTDSTERPFPSIRATTTRANDSPMLERKKLRRDHTSDFDFGEIDANEWHKTFQCTNESNELLMSHSPEAPPLDDEWERAFENILSRNPSMEPHVPAVSSNFDAKQRDPQNLELFWTQEDESPGTSAERKLSVIEELIANRTVRDKNDAKNQMKKPSGKMVQARVRRTSHSSVHSEVLDRSWDSFYENPNYSKEERSREFIRRNILRLPVGNTAQPKEDSPGADDAFTFDWLNDWCLGWRKAKQWITSNKYDYF